MKRFAAYLTVSLIASAVVAVCWGSAVSDSFLNTLYTVAGVVFSVGMSIAISPKTEEVTNLKMKHSIRRSYKRIRNTFMMFFAFDTVFLVLSSLEGCPDFQNIVRFMCLTFTLLSIAYFVWNFIELQKLGDDIEDQVLKERESDKP